MPRSPDLYQETAVVKMMERFMALSDDEVRYLGELQSHSEEFPARQEIISEGETYDVAFILIAGWAFRNKVLSDGRRQIQNYVLPGDVFGISSSLFAASSHSVECLTNCVVASFPAEKLIDLCANYPKLSIVVNWVAALHQEMLAEHIVSVGRRNAEERVSHLLIELLERLRITGMTVGDKFRFPLTQEHIADTLGLSIVHVNRTLRSMRAKGLLELSGGVIELPNVPQLQRIAKFDRLYFDGLRRLVDTGDERGRVAGR